MAGGESVASWISKHAPALREICETLRGIILDADPEIRESIKWGNPTYEKSGKVFYLAATERYASLGFFNGAGLTDPEGHIEGTGKKMRHVKVRQLEAIDRERFDAWIREAIALDAREGN